MTLDGPFGPIPGHGAGAGPGVLVLQEIFGLNRYVRSVVDELAAAGFRAWAPELFHREAPGFAAGYDPEGIAAGRAQIAALDLEGLHAEVEVMLRALGPGPVGVIGFCYGGLLAWEIHGLHPTAAAVAFYGRVHSPSLGGLAPIERTAGFRGPMLAHFASDDPSIPPEAVAAAAAALVRAPARGTIEVWPGVQHGFHCWDRAAHHPATAARAWEDTIRFLRAQLAAPA